MMASLLLRHFAGVTSVAVTTYREKVAGDIETAIRRGVRQSQRKQIVSGCTSPECANAERPERQSSLGWSFGSWTSQQQASRQERKDSGD